MKEADLKAAMQQLQSAICAQVIVLFVHWVMWVSVTGSFQVCQDESLMASRIHGNKKTLDWWRSQITAPLGKYSL